MSTDVPTMAGDDVVMRRLDEIRRWAGQPGPREVSMPVRRAAKSPGAFMAGLFGAFLTMSSVALLVVFFFVVQSVASSADAAEEGQQLRTLLGIFAAVALPELIVGVALIVVSVRGYRATRGLLSHGQIVRGRIARVSALPMKINARMFFRVCVEYVDAQGRRVVGKDTVDNLSVERFVQLRESQQEIEVLALPKCSRVMCLLRLAAELKLDE